MTSLLGVDVGTTGCKVVAVEDRGIQHRAHEEYPLEIPEEGAAELDPEQVWQALRRTIRQVAGKCDTPPEALCLSVLGEAVTALGRDRKPLRSTMVSLDIRPNIYFERVVDQISRDDIYEITGLEPLPHYSLFKWIWLLDRHPKIYEKSWKLLCYGELIAVRLGCEPMIDYSMAARTLALDRRSMNWSQEILEVAKIDVGKLPEVVPSGTRCGQITDEVSDDLGLARNATVVVGGIDQACAAAGAGLEIGGKSLLSIGTTAVIAELIPKETEYCGMIPVIPHVRDTANIAIAGTPAGGALLRWFRDTYDPSIEKPSDLSTSDTYSQIVNSAEKCLTDLIVIPHLGGSRVAFNDRGSTGAITGLTFGTKRSEIVRAMLEGVAFELGYMARRMREDGFNVQELLAVGGGSQSKLWLQIIADVLEVPVLSAESADAAAFGAALLAAENIGMDCDSSALVVRDRFDPNSDSVARYGAKIERFRRIYSALAEVN